MELYTGVVENRLDPLKLGRCQVRVVGIHTDDKNLLPTEDLPWAYPMQPVTSAAISGLGYSPTGPVPGTWVIILFRDQDQQQPIILGTVGGIPQTKSGSRAADDSNDSILPTEGGVLTDSSGNPVTDGSGQPITTGTNAANNSAPVPAPAAPAPATAPTTNTTNPNADIPTTPPPKSGATNKASDGIKALIAACDKVGLTTKYAKSALLGICGGESKWVPQKEDYNYNPTRLKQIFSGATPEIIEQYSYAVKKGMQREEFFSFFYGPNFRGKNFLGNKTPADAGKYYGRGLIQLTGRENYERFQKLGVKEGLNIDIVNNPDSLNDDLQVSALVAALYLKVKVKDSLKLQYQEGFFEAAKTSVGRNSPDIALVKKQYYEYFLGGATSIEPTNKDATAIEPNVDQKTIDSAPPEKKEAYKEDRSGNATQYGFTDPSGKYPLRDHMNESDTNRLARGIIQGTCFQFKDLMREKSVPTANGFKWSQPVSAYNTVYPYNKVFESESGHLMEFDDSPAGERIHLYHRKGTYLEMDPNGSQLNFVVGDNYQIILRNNNLYIKGSGNVTVAGNMRVLVQGNANIEVEGRSNITLKGDAEVGVAGNLDMTVGKDFNLKVDGDYNVMATNITNYAEEKHQTYASSNVEVKSDVAIHNIAEEVYINSTGDMNILAGGTLHADYSEGQFGNGATAAEVDEVAAIELTAPELLNSTVSEFENLPPPERSFDDIAKFETPDEWETPAGAQEKEKVYNTPEFKEPENIKIPEAQEVPPSIKPSPAPATKPVNTAPIYNTTQYGSSFKLSKYFTIAQLVQSDVEIRDVAIGGKVLTKQDIVANLAALATNICDPLYELLGPTSGKFAPQSPKGAWCINSGLRNGSGRSQHERGQAIDIRYNPQRNFKAMWDFSLQLEKLLPYDQIILEYRRPGSKHNQGTGWMNWIHISYDAASSRRQAFTMIDDSSVNAQGQVAPGSRGLYLFGTA
jgi:predicted chitinase